jgi:cytoskeletal protein CcmA (bactofilin family)
MSFRREKSTPPPPSRHTVAPMSPSSGKIETVIGPNCHVHGTMQSDGGIRIDGVFQGEIDTAGNLIVGESAKVIAEITANNISVSGAVKGNISGNRVEVLETGRVWGDLTVNSLLLNEGAYLRGQTMMHADIEPPMIEPPKSSQAPPPPPPPPEPKSSEPMMGEIVDIEPEE